MEDVLQFGTIAGIFTPANVMNLLYGKIEYTSHQVAKTKKSECFFEWDGVEGLELDWRSVPFEYRKELVSLIIKSIKEKKCYYADFNCFHIRIKCLLHELLNDKDNEIDCIGPIYNYTIPYNKYSARVYHTLQMQGAVAEMFLWWRLGIRKSDQEKQLLKKCWEKFLGTLPSRLQGQTLRMVKAKIETLEAEYQKATHIHNVNDGLYYKKYSKERKAIKKRHFSAPKKEMLLQQLEKKENAANNRCWKAEVIRDRCQTALDFLKGYLDYVSMMSKKA